MKVIILSIILLTIFACTPPEMPTPTPPPCVNNCDTFPLTEVWQKPIKSDTTESNLQEALVIENNILFKKIFDGNREVLQLKDGTTGETIWNWKDETNSIDDGGSITQTRYSDNNILAAAHRHIFNINSATGITNWHSTVPNPGSGGVQLSVFNNLAFHCRKNGWPATSASVTCTNINAPSWDTLFTIYKKGTFYPDPGAPSIYVNAVGDTILLNVAIYWNSTTQYANLYAFNKTKDTMLWSLDSIDYALSPNPAPIKNGTLYIAGWTKVLSINIETGQINWEKENFANALLDNGLILINNSLYINTSGNDGLYCLDANTGAKLGKSSNYGNVGELKHYNGRIYFTSA
ncbi:MAG: PQQ-binding-like beta-propeller repeat protein, partial [Saprospiraceae bacterium]